MKYRNVNSISILSFSQTTKQNLPRYPQILRNTQTHLIHQTTQTKMRLPYADPSSPKFSSPADRAIIERVEARRAPRPLQPLDLTLLHSPPVADGWNSFLGAVRTQTGLADDIREIAICRVAICNRAWYEWGHHAPLAKKGGVSDEGMEVLKREKCEREGQGDGNGNAEGLSGKQWAVVKYTDEMTRNVRVPEEVFEDLKRCFDEKEIVELTATIAAYNCVSRFLVALDVGERNKLTGPDDVAH
ncbi:c18d35a9-584c-47b1-adb0-070cab7e2ff0 [Sclerotinia trifoliorum]|uniref:C18d35a9-584c-47b1-adb0-070cab7e2ff0 n=1 Tax=Sclerotinia trifoliorum TaxID=28548 RepID=A0A8H2VQT6_9HELO|nr:c18d35a9-584c-47b1-adb0-070cab7e2ff0 [Sclerotinia trifoliorum]